LDLFQQDINNLKIEENEKKVFTFGSCNKIFLKFSRLD